MNAYNYQKRLKEIWESAVSEYREGCRKPAELLDEKAVEDLKSMGLNVMDVYDYAEDFVAGGDPDLETFIMICEARRDYFLNKQKGKLSDKVLDSSTLPAKDSELKGIVWLPRIIVKAKSKLRGELPPETMYCCGGDRRFLKANDIHPAEFLRAVWAYEDNEAKLCEWVEARRPKA